MVKLIGVVGRALEQHRQPLGALGDQDDRVQLDPVAHGDHRFALLVVVAGMRASSQLAGMSLPDCTMSGVTAGDWATAAMPAPKCGGKDKESGDNRRLCALFYLATAAEGVQVLAGRLGDLCLPIGNVGLEMDGSGAGRSRRKMLEKRRFGEQVILGWFFVIH